MKSYPTPKKKKPEVKPPKGSSPAKVGMAGAILKADYPNKKKAGK